ncbi:MAG: phosphopyruvate hydratase [SAR202 cluster bacterium]|nr:phosphopyruvate hydratase [SAR202 cluster bacterium]
MVKIADIKSREIIDSRGNPTVEASLTLTDGSSGTAAVPSGASTGKHEAVELRDGGQRYQGKGVLKSINNINNLILPSIKNVELKGQEDLDQILIDLDDSRNKANIGANSTLAVSLAFSKALSNNASTPLFRHLNSDNKYILPVPMMNILNGGKHAEGSTDIQEFMIVPIKFNTFSESLRAGCEVYQTLKSLIHKKGMDTAVGDEGGFAPKLNSNKAAIELILESIELSGYIPGEHFLLALDCAASELYDGSKYTLKVDQKNLNGVEMVNLYNDWISKYPIISIEDGLDEDSWTDWKLLTKTIGSKTQIVGDDLLTTNPTRIQKAITDNCANALLVKPNQIGTLSETIEATSLAKKSNWGTIMSHRSGETEDTFIADLAVGIGTGQIKCGAPARAERTAKYNRLLRIEEELSGNSSYAGLYVYETYI